MIRAERLHDVLRLRALLLRGRAKLQPPAKEAEADAGGAGGGGALGRLVALDLDHDSARALLASVFAYTEW